MLSTRKGRWGPAGKSLGNPVTGMASINGWARAIAIVSPGSFMQFSIGTALNGGRVMDKNVQPFFSTL